MNTKEFDKTYKQLYGGKKITELPSGIYAHDGVEYDIFAMHLVEKLLYVSPTLYGADSYEEVKDEEGKVTLRPKQRPCIWIRCERLALKNNSQKIKEALKPNSKDKGNKAPLEDVVLAE